MIGHAGTAALLLGAIFSWRWSWRIAGALALACVASLLFFVHPAEPMRWVSALVGFAGAIELGDAATDAVRNTRTPQGAIAAMHRRGWLGLICLCSMASDMFALLSWKAVAVWPMPFTQIGWSLLLIIVGAWPARRSS